MEPTKESPAAGFLSQIQEFASANPWVMLIAGLIILIIIGQIIWKMVKAARFSMADGLQAGKIRKVLSKCRVGKANVILGTQSTVVEITNNSDVPFTLTRVSLVKNKVEFPLKLAYSGRISPPRTLPKVCDQHRGPAVLQPQETFVFAHPINAIFILNEKESFHVVMDAKYQVQGSSKTLTEETSKKKASSLETW